MRNLHGGCGFPYQEGERGEAQDATLKRESAREDLIDYMEDFLDVAVLALKKTPQLLEQLGIVVKR